MGSPSRLAILIPNVWGIRNIVHSGVLQQLSEMGVEVHLLMRRLPQQPQDVNDDYHYAYGLHQILTPNLTKRRLGKSFLDGVIYSAFMQRNHIRSYSIYSHWFRRNETPRQYVRSRLIHALGKLTRFPTIYCRLQSLSELLYRRGADITPIYKHLRQISPDLLWSTAYITPDEHAYVMAAHDLNIPVLGSILSFDNLTSRTSYLQCFYHYTVWSEWMKQQLVRFYPHVLPEQVTVTGTPQFDFHRKKEYCLTRQETLALLGLAVGDQYFVYGASTRQLAPEEPDLVRLLVRRISKDEKLRNYKIIVRLHPLDDWTRWRNKNEYSDTVILSGAWTTKPDSDGWAFITPKEQMRLVSLLSHADACINIASTIGLDAAVLDCPVIGIDFRNEPQAPHGLLYEEYYTEHYLPLIESGAVKVASSWDQLMDLLNEAVLSPDRYQENRRQAVRKLCGEVDGQAATRLASTALDILVRAQKK